MVKRYKQYDKLINSHIADFGFITVRQCASIFYKGHKYPQIEANRKLKTMMDKGWLRRCKDKRSDQFIYFSEGINEVPTLSHILLMDFYAAMVNAGAVIEEFRTEVEWKSTLVNTKPMRSDGYCLYNYHNGEKVTRHALLIEVDVTHKYELSNYERLYLNKEVQEKFKKEFGIDNYFPDLVVITKKLNPTKHIGNVNVIYLNYSLDHLAAKIL